MFFRQVLNKRLGNMPLRVLVLIGIVMHFSNVFSQSDSITKPMDLYLLIGQSNMAGRGSLTDSIKAIVTNPNILMLNEANEWIPAKHPLHFDKKYAAVGPGLSFAEDMLQENGLSTIGLIPCAWGGSPIRVWKPGVKYFDKFPYELALERAQIAMKQGNLKGILWHQGESDNTAEKSEIYLEQLKTLVSRLRKDLKTPNLPFVAGEIGYFNKKDYINEQINKLPDAVNHTAVVSAKGLADKGDKLHFNAASAQMLGKRYALAMKRLQKSLRPTVVLTFDDAEISHYLNVAPLLLEYGFNATFFICEFPLQNLEEKKAYMQWNQILALHKMGFEIGNHTWHHKNVTKLREEELLEEIQYIEDKCEKYGMPKPVSFAYPGNRYDSVSQNILKKRGYQFARVGGSEVYKVNKHSSLAIPSYTVASTKKLNNRVKSALKHLGLGEVLVLTFHGVPDEIHPDYSTDLSHLKAILNYVKLQDFNVVAMKNLKD